jgi:hypothetical protein
MEEKMIKILQVLDRSGDACSLGYITLHTSIIEPLELLEILEREGYVQRCKRNSWSPSSGLRFQIAPSAKQKLRELEGEVLRVPLQVVADVYATSPRASQSRD